ncbi:hypothetical protein BsWGS_13182 [Bradybaena similaris]
MYSLCLLFICLLVIGHLSADTLARLTFSDLSWSLQLQFHLIMSGDIHRVFQQLLCTEFENCMCTSLFDRLHCVMGVVDFVMRSHVPRSMPSISQHITVSCWGHMLAT